MSRQSSKLIFIHCLGQCLFPSPTLSLFLQQWAMTQSGEREEDRSHPHPPEVIVSFSDPASNRQGWIFVEANSILCSESEKLLPIGLTSMVHGTDSYFPHLKAGFAKHRKLARQELPGGGGREEKFPTWQEGAALLPLPQPIWPSFVLG